MSRPLLIENARLVDPASGRDAPGWLLIRDGLIADIGDGAAANTDDAERIDARGLVLAPALVDLRVATGEPGAEHKETLSTASAASAAGGVGTIVTTPDTHPVIDDPALIDFLLRRARDTARVRVLPGAALTVGLHGERMAEIGLLREAGAVLFSNGAKPVASARVLRRALQYANSVDALVSIRPEDTTLATGGVANDGEFAGRMGLAGVPALAERIQIERDAAIAEDAGARLLFDQLSSAAGVDALAAARSRGVRVSASVSAAHLALNELDVGDYRTHCRLSPPLRSEADRNALIDAVQSGVIDAVVSAHDPQPAEDKRLPFAEATPGAVGLETLASVLFGLVHEERLTLIEALRPVTSAPADLLGLPHGRMAKGAPADVVLFDVNAPWVCRNEDLRSRSRNSPFDDRRLQGRAVRTIVGGKTVFVRETADA